MRQADIAFHRAVRQSGGANPCTQAHRHRLPVGKSQTSVEALPLEQISEDVRTVVKSLDNTLKSVERQLTDDSMLQQDLRDTLRELSKAAAEARALLEYQSRHPEALIRGKTKEE